MSSGASASLCVISFWACPGASSGRKSRALLVLYYSSPVHRHRPPLDPEVGATRPAGSGNCPELHNCSTPPCYVAATGPPVGQGTGARSLGEEDGRVGRGGDVTWNSRWDR